MEIGGLFVVAMLVRQLCVAAGPGNLYSLLPNPHHPPSDFELFGPGLAAWMLGWFGLFGADDRIAFLAGAVAGASTVIPVYCLAWLASGNRSAGLFAGVLIALWPIHARLSPTDDASVLIALLIASAVALVVMAERLGSGVLLVAAWMAAALAATTRPEPALAWGPLGLMVLIPPTVRRIQFKPMVLLSTALVIAAAGSVLFFTVAKALHGGFSPSGSLQIQHLVKLLGCSGGSILSPPRSHWLLSASFVVGFVGCLVADRGRSGLWLAAGLLPAFPTASIAGPDIVTARYQLALVSMAAACMGVGLIWLGARLRSWRASWARIGVPALVVIPLTAIAWGWISPPPEPTFRLEYAFFRNHIKQVPSKCVLVRVRWNVDLGLGLPTNLTDLLATGHTWTTLDADLDPATQCLVYWQPASCRAVAPGLGDSSQSLLPDCQAMESGFLLEPIATGKLPARTGFCETYREDPVPVGFFRLHPLPVAEPPTGSVVIPGQEAGG